MQSIGEISTLAEKTTTDSGYSKASRVGLRTRSGISCEQREANKPYKHKLKARQAKKLLKNLSSSNTPSDVVSTSNLVVSVSI